MGLTTEQLHNKKTSGGFEATAITSKTKYRQKTKTINIRTKQ